MDIAYTEEWTWAASLGRLLLALAFAGGIAATIGYTKAVRNNDEHWLKLGRWGFRFQATGLFAASALMFLLIFSHRYEFQYIWKHLNDAMSFGLVIASFWGGQEGGFLLWMCWMLVLVIIVDINVSRISARSTHFFVRSRRTQRSCGTVKGVHMT